ncbi:hypothetical protein HMI55_000809 [Coelomomyces lativittatus]|nr:hypothetical protein HMI55_000809 [Coelomomyces lativittatus]
MPHFLRTRPISFKNLFISPLSNLGFNHLRSFPLVFQHLPISSSSSSPASNTHGSLPAQPPSSPGRLAQFLDSKQGGMHYPTLSFSFPFESLQIFWRGCFFFLLKLKEYTNLKYKVHQGGNEEVEEEEEEEE